MMFFAFIRKKPHDLMIFSTSDLTRKRELFRASDISRKAPAS